MIVFFPIWKYINTDSFCTFFIAFAFSKENAMKRIAKRNVLITGGALGMGRSLARLFLIEGARVALVDIREDELYGTADAFEKYGEVQPFACDLSEMNNIYDLKDKVEREFGPVEILVNNAGIVKSHRFLDKPDEFIQKLININLMAVFWTMKAFLPGMITKGEGYVVNMSSAGGLLAVPYISDYSASKFAVIGLTEALRQEFKIEGLKNIRFMYVCPNTVSTGLFEGARMVKGTQMLSSEDVTKRILKGIRKNRTFIGVPNAVYAVPLIKSLIPIPAMDFIGRALGISTSSKGTLGRE